MKRSIVLFIISLLTGVLLTLGWPPFHYGIFMFIFLTPLLYAVESEKSFFWIFFFCYFSFLPFTVTNMYWIGDFSRISSSVNFINLAVALVPFQMGLPVFFWRCTRSHLNKYIYWMSLPVFWTCFEYLHGRWDLAFNWFDTGLGLSAYPRFISFYQYAGMQGATLFILALNVLFYILVKYRKKRNIFRWSFSLLIVSFLFFCSTYLHHAEEGEHDKSMIKKIAVIQANPPLKPDTNSLYLEFNTLKEMVLPFKEQHPDLIVCPEGYFESAPGDFPVLLNYIEDDTIIKKLKMLSAQVNAPILAGMLIGNIFASSAPPTLTAKPIKPGFYYDTYNAALMISAKQPTQVYTKHKMVPFEERIPFLSFFSLLERWHILALKTQSSFSLLNDEGIFTCGEMKILPAICFETVFPDYLAEIVRKRGANMIAVISSDNWALNSTGYKRNASYCTPLAIELQLPLVRSVTTGLSLVLDKYGNVKKIAGWNEQKVLIEDIELNNKRTFYIKYGNIAGLLSMYAFFIISLFCIFSFLIKKLY